MHFVLISLLVLLVIYHVSEYVIHKHFHPNSTNLDSFLITKGYLLALTVGIVEYFLECIKFYDFKNSAKNPMIYIGIVMISLGLFFRFSAMLHAGANFTHQISTSKLPEHKLVTDGVYKYVRHPSYLGFYLFAVGTQIYISNVVSPIGFAVVLWIFFNDRIVYEEAYLIDFFDKDYKEYRRKTKTWIPFIE